METKKYIFEEITHCEMCGDSTEKHKILGQRLNCSQGFRPKRKTGISVSVKQCTKCQLIYSSPQPIPFDIQDHYGIPPENYWVPEYFNWTPDYYLQEINTLNKIKEITVGMKALDIGAGIGKCMLSLKNAGFEAYGFEPSKPFYERAISKMNIPIGNLKFGKIEDMEYKQDSFDFITFGAVFEHLYHPALCLKKALQWVKPGGIVHIEVPSSKHLIAKIFNLYYRLLGTNYVTSLSPMNSPFHLYEFGYNSFTELSKKLNYEIVFHEYYVCDIWHIPKIFHPPLRKIMKWTDTGLQLAVWLTKK
ncbi:MAG: class I SAM-dependent methyltransferase [Chitinophagaceae bacterium]|nr:class I SAM-dependent methyltransferase [Chitinophagaceae bacterium]